MYNSLNKTEKEKIKKVSLDVVNGKAVNKLSNEELKCSFEYLQQFKHEFGLKKKELLNQKIDNILAELKSRGEL